MLLEVCEAIFIEDGNVEALSEPFGFDSSKQQSLQTMAKNLKSFVGQEKPPEPYQNLGKRERKNIANTENALREGQINCQSHLGQQFRDDHKSHKSKKAFKTTSGDPNEASLVFKGFLRENGEGCFQGALEKRS